MSISSKSRRHISLIWVWVKLFGFNFSSTVPLHLQACETKMSSILTLKQPTYNGSKGVVMGVRVQAQDAAIFLFIKAENLRYVGLTIPKSSWANKWSLRRFSGLGILFHDCLVFCFGYWFHSLNHPSFFHCKVLYAFF